MFFTQKPQGAGILLIKLRHYGDVLLVTPVINSLKLNMKLHNYTHIDLLLYEETKEIVAANQDITHIYSIDWRWKKQGWHRQLFYLWRLIKTLHRQRYHTVLNLSDQWGSAIITLLTGAKIRIGFDLQKRRHWLWRICHNQRVSTSQHQQQHTVEQNLSILTPLALPEYSSTVTMSYNNSDQLFCQSQIPRHWQGNYLVIQPVARWLFKSWPAEQVCVVVNELCRIGYNVVLTASNNKQELAMINQIMISCQSQSVISLAGQLTLCQLAALIDHARLFIGVDSAPMHIAAAVQTPAVVLFGPSKRVFWHPWQVAARVIWAGDYGDLPDPDQVDTKTDQRYLAMIPPQVVTEAVLAMLRQDSAP